MSSYKETRKIMIIKPSKYERSESIRRNKKYWKNKLGDLDIINNETLNPLDVKCLTKILTDDLCERVCNILGYKPISQSNENINILPEQYCRRLRKEPLLSYRKSIFIDRELDSDTDVEILRSENEEKFLNIHQKFLSKPEREQVTWNTRFLQPEREDEKSLVKKADDLTDRIAHEFCEYMKDLGGDQQSQLFTAKTIKELFQVEFDTHVARSLQVVPKEMPTVIDNIAKATGNLELSRNAALTREITKDIRAEKQSDYVKAFGRSLPRRDQFRAPKNDTKNQWRSARHVPKDLVTLKTVWEGITNLRSVKEYCRWMIQHPEYRRAPYLNSLGMFDPVVLNARLTMELQHDTIVGPQPSDDNTAASIKNLRKRLSEMNDTQ